MRYRIGAMHIGQILDTAFEVFRDHSKTLLAITAVVFGPYLILYFGSAFSGVWPVFKIISAYKAEAWRQYLEYSRAYGIGVAAFILLQMVFDTFVGGALALATASLYLNNPVSVSASILFMLSRWWPLFKTFLIMSPLYILSSVNLLIIKIIFDALGRNLSYPGIIFTFIIVAGVMLTLVLPFIFGKVSLVLNVVIFEELSGWKAIIRGMSLMKGSLVQGIILHISNFVFVLVAGGVIQFIPFDYLQFTFNIVINIVINVFFIAASVILYFSARSKRENFDIEYMAQYATA